MCFFLPRTVRNGQSAAATMRTCRFLACGWCGLSGRYEGEAEGLAEGETAHIGRLPAVASILAAYGDTGSLCRVERRYGTVQGEENHVVAPFRARGRRWWLVRGMIRGHSASGCAGRSWEDRQKARCACRQRSQACMLCCPLRRRQVMWRVPVCLPTKNGLSPRGNSPFFVHAVRHSSVAAVPGKAT